MEEEPPLVDLFIALVTRLRPEMVRRARRRTGDDAEDVVQEALVRAWRYWPPHHFRQLDHWLFQVLNSRIAQWNREKMYIRHRAPRQVPQICRNIPRGNGHELAQTLAAIPPTWRRIVELDALGYTTKEQAALEHCPMGTVLSRLYRARRLLAG